MAFMFPIAVGGATVVSGFVLGYYYQPKVQFINGISVKANNLTTNDLKQLKDQYSREDINKELVNFDKKKLKKIKSQNLTLCNADLLNELKQIMIIRRQKII
jgi:hypothetical protein